MNQAPPPDRIRWLKPSGAPVSCTEKVKVLDENYADLRQQLQDMLDDALLMGCDEAQVRQAFAHLALGLPATVAPSGE
ncbi:hypothetical protein [Amphibiibacter pelophylacis]|uniref:Uncharacterized protein n=1 Tax=Amphibiibacter pelophylacis TaxID=1799477 RepID=A0ACC6P3T6_9BURK